MNLLLLSSKQIITPYFIESIQHRKFIQKANPLCGNVAVALFGERKVVSSIISIAAQRYIVVHACSLRAAGMRISLGQIGVIEAAHQFAMAAARDGEDAGSGQ